MPVDPSFLGDLSGSTRPRIRQLFLGRGPFEGDALERKLYVIRRLAEKKVASWHDVDASQFYIPSLSGRTIVYKGLLTGSQLPQFYPDLKNELFMSPYAVVHQRYSTNTLPTWHLAHPFRIAAHNGEINTLRGNINRMRAREANLASPLFGNDIAKLRPIINEAGSDSAIFDNVLELLVMSGRSLPHAVMMMIPESWGPKFQMSEDKRSFYEYHSAIMEPWDGPAAMVFCDGRYLGATLDRNGLRPARYTVTRDGMIVLASETGVMDIPPDRIVRRRPAPAGEDAPPRPAAEADRPGQRDQGGHVPPEAVPEVGQGQQDRAAGDVRPVRDPPRRPGDAPAEAARLRLHRGGDQAHHHPDGVPGAGGGRLDGGRRGAGGPLEPAAGRSSPTSSSSSPR